ALTLSYVLFAPFVGPLADAFRKARLMAWMNTVKMVGAVMMIAGGHPVLAFAVVGFGAAAYAPAKYGLITELVPAHRLVAANGWIEVTIVCAALLGSVLGGVLVSPGVLASAPFMLAHDALRAAPGLHDSAYIASLLALLMVYGLAALLNVGVPDSGARYPASRIHLAVLSAEFWHAHLTLWRDRDGALSLAVTTIFWGVGATLQFAVLRWAADVLQLPLSQAAYLQAAVAVGVVVGAGAAGRLVPLVRAKRVLWVGVALGLMMPVVASADTLYLAVPMLALVGAVAGFMVVPLNALLQHRGCQLLSAGRSVAVQGFNENASVLAMLAVYAALTALEVPIVALLWGFGLCIAAAIALLIRSEHSRNRLALSATAAD
ncbi:MAG TPA: lysophospholipid transporter LplT, partial [Burkholderiaceae bacterium]|nr:lysophospholipid transporter LplT [Burkholderiaceae bacterium]